jgi:hypothetical protein
MDNSIENLGEKGDVVPPKVIITRKVLSLGRACK